MKLRTKSTLKTGNMYLFSGPLRCADCKQAMERVTVKKDNGKVYVNYRCHTYTAYSYDACTKHTIAEHKVETAVLQTIQNYTQVLMDFERVFAAVDCRKHRQNQVDRLDHGISKSRQELVEIERSKLGLYTDLKKGLLTQEDYISLKSGYAGQSATLTAQVVSLQEERNNLDAREVMQNEWLQRFKKYREIETLNRSLVTELIDRIDIHEGRRLTFHFKFQDELEKSGYLPSRNSRS